MQRVRMLGFLKQATWLPRCEVILDRYGALKG